MKQFGRYRIEAEIGRGAFGRIYAAFDPLMNRRVAIKVLSGMLDDDALQRFQAEAGTTAKLSHKNVVRVHEYAQEQGCPYLVMELLEGRNLQTMIESGDALPLLEKVDIMYQVAEGLKYAHENGVVHQDIKPGNIMVGKDRMVKIMDFGTAGILGKDGTQSGAFRGTVPYLSPEFINAGQGGRKADIFSYGVVYYELLTGNNPFRGADDAASMYLINTLEPRPVAEIVKDCPAALNTLVGTLLVKDPEMRCGSVEDVLLDSDPIVRELRGRRVEELFSGIAPLIESGDFAAARELIGRVLELRPDDAPARALREDLRRREQDRLQRSRLKSWKDDGKRLMAAGEFAGAIVPLETALKLDAADAEAQALFQEAKSALERARKAARLLAEARWEKRSGGDLNRALEKAGEAAQILPTAKEAADLAAELERLLAARRETAVVTDAKRLFMERRYAEARSMLDQLVSNAPLAGDAAALRAAIGQQERQEEFLRTERTAAAVRFVRQAISGGDFDEARRALEAGRHEFPENDELNELVQVLSDAVCEHERSLEIEKAAMRIRTMAESGQIHEALADLQTALAQFGENPALTALRQDIETATALEAKRKEEEQGLVTAALEELAQNGPGVERAAQRSSEFLSCLAARSRALCALQQINSLDLDAAILAIEAALAQVPGSGELTSALEGLRKRRREEGDRRESLERDLKALEKGVLASLEKEDFAAAERRLMETRISLGNEETWRRLDREFGLRQRYRTGLLMAEKARSSGDVERAKGVLAALLVFAPDSRARDLLDSIQKAEADLALHDVAAETPAQRGAHEAVQSEGIASPSWKKWQTPAAAAVSLLIVTGLILFEAEKGPRNHSGAIGESSAEAEAKWREMEGTQDAGAVERYLSSYPRSPFHAAALRRLDELSWQHLDRNDLAALQGFVKRFPASSRVTEANGLIESIARDRQEREDRSAILNLISGYAGAIRHKNAAQLRRVWPSIPPVDFRLWNNIFRQAASIAMEVEPIGPPNVSQSGARVNCRRKTERVYLDGRQVSDNSVIYFLLRKGAKGWAIASVSAP